MVAELSLLRVCLLEMASIDPDTRGWTVGQIWGRPCAPAQVQTECWLSSLQCRGHRVAKDRFAHEEEVARAQAALNSRDPGMAAWLHGEEMAPEEHAAAFAWTALCTLHSTPCTLCTLLCTVLYSLHCTLCTCTVGMLGDCPGQGKKGSLRSSNNHLQPTQLQPLTKVWDIASDQYATVQHTVKVNNVKVPSSNSCHASS